ncbi:hypothetical protein ACP4OV_027744 [Aristida adscensionis]
MDITEGMTAVDRVPDNPKMVMIMNTQEYYEIPLRGDGVVPLSNQSLLLQSHLHQPHNKCAKGRKRKQTANVESVASAGSPQIKTRSSPRFAHLHAAEPLVNKKQAANEVRRPKAPRTARQKQKVASTRGRRKKVDFTCTMSSTPPVSEDVDPLLSNEQANATREQDNEDDEVDHVDEGYSRTKINVRCNPGDVVVAISMMTDEQHLIITKLGFADLLGIRPSDMIMRIGPGKELPITPREIGIVLGLPTSGRSIDVLPWKEAVKCRRLFCEQIGVDFNQAISREYLLERVFSGDTDPVTIRSFLMVLFNRLLFLGSSCHISTSDIAKTRAHEAFCEIDWSKEVYNDIQDAVEKWHKRKPDQPTQTIFGCAVFLIVYYLDNLRHKRAKMDWITTPRVRLYSKRSISKLARADILDKSSRNESYGKLPFKNWSYTCYAHPGEGPETIPPNDTSKELQSENAAPSVRLLLQSAISELPDQLKEIWLRVFAGHNAEMKNHMRNAQLSHRTISQVQMKLAREAIPVLQKMAKHKNQSSTGDAINDSSSSSDSDSEQDSDDSQDDDFIPNQEEHVSDDNDDPTESAPTANDPGWTTSQEQRAISQAENEFYYEHGCSQDSGTYTPSANDLTEPQIEKYNTWFAHKEAHKLMTGEKYNGPPACYVPFGSQESEPPYSEPPPEKSPFKDTSYGLFADPRESADIDSLAKLVNSIYQTEVIPEGTPDTQDQLPPAFDETPTNPCPKCLSPVLHTLSDGYCDLQQSLQPPFLTRHRPLLVPRVRHRTLTRHLITTVQGVNDGPSQPPSDTMKHQHSKPYRKALAGRHPSHRLTTRLFDTTTCAY